MKEPNIIRIKALGGSYYEQDVILNSKECQLLLDKTCLLYTSDAADE